MLDWVILPDEDVQEIIEVFDSDIYVFDTLDVVGLFSGIQRKYYKDEDATIKYVAAKLENANAFTKQLSFFPSGVQPIINNKRYIYDENKLPKLQIDYDITNYEKKSIVDFLKDFSKRFSNPSPDLWTPFESKGYPINEDTQAEVVWKDNGTIRSTPMRVLKGEGVSYYGVRTSNNEYNLVKYTEFLKSLKTNDNVFVVSRIGTDAIPGNVVTSNDALLEIVCENGQKWIFRRNKRNNFGVIPTKTSQLYAKTVQIDFAQFNLAEYFEYIKSLEVNNKVVIIPNIGNKIQGTVVEASVASLLITTNDGAEWNFQRGSVVRILRNRFALHPSPISKLYAKANVLRTPSIVYYFEDATFKPVPIRHLLPTTREYIAYSTKSTSLYSVREFENEYQTLDETYIKDLISKNINALVVPVKDTTFSSRPQLVQASNTEFLKTIPGKSDVERMYYLLKNYNEFSQRLFATYIADIAEPKQNVSLRFAQTITVDEILNIHNHIKTIEKTIPQPKYKTLWEAIQSPNPNSYVFNPSTRQFYVIENYQISARTPYIAEELFPGFKYDPERHVILSVYGCDCKVPKLSNVQTVSKYHRDHPFDIEESELHFKEYQYDSDDEDDDFEKMFNNLEFGVQLTTVEEEVDDEDLLVYLVDSRVANILRSLQKEPTIKLNINEQMLIRIIDHSRQHVLDADIYANELQQVREELTKAVAAKGKKISKEKLEAKIRETQQQLLFNLQNKGLGDVRYAVVALVSLAILVSLPNRTTSILIPMLIDRNTEVLIIEHIVNYINTQASTEEQVLDVNNAYKIYKRFREKPSWKHLFDAAKKVLEGNKTAVQKENLIILERYFLWKTFKPIDVPNPTAEKQLQRYSMIDKTHTESILANTDLAPSISMYTPYQPKAYLTFSSPIINESLQAYIRPPLVGFQSVHETITDKWDKHGDGKPFQSLSSEVAGLVAGNTNLGISLFVVGPVSINHKDMQFLYNYMIGVLKPTLQHIIINLSEDTHATIDHLESDDKVEVVQAAKQYVSRIKEFYDENVIDVCTTAMQDPVLANSSQFEIDVTTKPVEAIYVYAYCIAKTLKTLSVHERLHAYLIEKLLIQQHFTQHTLSEFDVEYRKQREQEKNKLINEKKAMDAEAKRLQREMKAIGLEYKVAVDDVNNNELLADVLPQPLKQNDREQELANMIRDNHGEEADYDDE